MTCNRVLRRLQQWDGTLAGIETALLAVLILGSLAASLVQIGLRNFAGLALPGVDPAVRRAVLWIALLGASLATHRGSHLAVDVAEQVLPARVSRLVGAAAHLVAAAVTGVLAVAAGRFVAAELAFAGGAAAAAAAVMPIGFAVMTARFAVGAWRRLAAGDGGAAFSAAGGGPATGSAGMAISPTDASGTAPDGAMDTGRPGAGASDPDPSGAARGAA